MTALHRPLLHGIKRLQAGNNFTAGKHPNIKLAAGNRPQTIGQDIGCAKNGIQALGKTRGQAPLDGG